MSLRVVRQKCPACGPSWFVRLGAGEMAVRCMRCRSSPVTLSLIAAVERSVSDLGERHCYELSSRGPLVRYLRRHARQLTTSEFFDGVAPGDWRGGVQCQDVERLTHGDDSFDLCTSTEVFEHVGDDRRGFREVLRVLRPGGWLFLTVPLRTGATLIRAIRTDHGVQHLLPPTYHSDRMRGKGAVLCFRDYGLDIVDRLREAGFDEAVVDFASIDAWCGVGRPVVIARKRAHGAALPDHTNDRIS